MSMNLSGLGTTATYNPGYGDPDGWGGPQNGVDILNHLGDVVTPRSSRVSSDTYMFVTIVGALAILWILGGIVFKNARL